MYRFQDVKRVARGQQMPESFNKSVSLARVRARRRRLIAALSIVLTAGLCGCSSVSSLRSITSSGTWNDTVETLRNRSYSAKAWHRRKQNFCDMQSSRDFQAGFRAGYEAIADGKPGCPPSFPPKEYWSWEFQSTQGQARIAAWFQGYPYGVQAARDDGVSSYSHLLSSSECGQCGSNGCGPNGCGTGQTAIPMAGSVYQQSDAGSGTYQVIGDQGTAVPGYPVDTQSPPTFPVTN